MNFNVQRKENYIEFFKEL